MFDTNVQISRIYQTFLQTVDIDFVLFFKSVIIGEDTVFLPLHYLELIISYFLNKEITNGWILSQ